MPRLALSLVRSVMYTSSVDGEVESKPTWSHAVLAWGQAIGPLAF
jgi:hypothetical protein